MTIVCQEELRTFFSTIFGIDEKFIIPKQWNWYNPQSSLELVEKPLTWLAYRIKSNDPISTNWKNENNDLESYNIASIELQFIGKRAEEYANSIQFFPERQDVMDELVDCEGVIMRTDFKVYTTDYIQDGLNSILAFNTNFKIEWTKKQVVNQDIAEGIYGIGGSINE
jgi:hypothetical protein